MLSTCCIDIDIIVELPGDNCIIVLIQSRFILFFYETECKRFYENIGSGPAFYEIIRLINFNAFKLVNFHQVTHYGGHAQQDDFFLNIVIELWARHNTIMLSMEENWIRKHLSLA